MTRPLSTILCLLLLSVPFPAQAVLVNLSPEQVRAAETFAAEHGKKTGLILNNQYAVGRSEIFSERVVVRSKWHKYALMTAIKNRKNQKMTEKERADILNDPFLQIDILLFGYSIDFAKNYRVKIIYRGKEVLPEKIHADHFQIAQQIGGHYSGFPSYRATVRTYFRYDRLCSDCRLTLKTGQNGHDREFPIDMNNYK